MIWKPGRNEELEFIRNHGKLKDSILKRMKRQFLQGLKFLLIMNWTFLVQSSLKNCKFNYYANYFFYMI